MGRTKGKNGSFMAIRMRIHQNFSSFSMTPSGFPTEKKSSGRSHKNRNLAREQGNKIFTVARAHAIKNQRFFH